MLEAMSLGTPVKALSTTLDHSTLSATAEFDKSPLLFDSDEENDEAESITDSVSIADETSIKSDLDIRDEKFILKLKTTLAGVPPPPKFTIPQFSAAEMLDMYNKNIAETTEYLQKVNHTDDTEIHAEMKALEYPASKNCLYFGLHYNRGLISEEYEVLSNKYQQRYVGSETSCTIIDKKSSSVSDSLTGSAKKRARKYPWNHSPGRRLSHLARRRQIFTSASLPRAAIGSRNKASAIDSKRMILLDNRKSSSSTSARSRLASLTLSSQPSTSSYSLSSQASTSFSQMPKLEPQITLPSQVPSLKRALFQSPDVARETVNHARETPRTDKNRARRALFSSGNKKGATPNKRTPCKKTPNKKTPNKRTPRRTPHKGTPTSSRKKTPRKSLFSDPDDRNRYSSRDQFNMNGKRHRSESLLNLNGESSQRNTAVTLSSDEKKKLLWVVYHCLKERKINSRNTLYKACQNYLYRVCSNEWKAQLAEQPVGTRCTNVSEKLLNIARKHVSSVILKVKNNQSFYRSSAALRDNSSESGDTSITSLSRPKSNPRPSECKSAGQESLCEDRSDVESVVKSDFDKESICVRSDVDSTYSCSLKRGSFSSCLQDEESNTTCSAFFMSDSLLSDTNTSSSIPNSMVDIHLPLQSKGDSTTPNGLENLTDKCDTVVSDTLVTDDLLCDTTLSSIPIVMSNALPCNNMKSIPIVVSNFLQSDSIRSSVSSVVSNDLPSASTKCCIPISIFETFLSDTTTDSILKPRQSRRSRKKLKHSPLHSSSIPMDTSGSGVVDKIDESFVENNPSLVKLSDVNHTDSSIPSNPVFTSLSMNQEINCSVVLDRLPSDSLLDAPPRTNITLVDRDESFLDSSSDVKREVVPNERITNHISDVKKDITPNGRSLIHSMSCDVRKVLEINGVPNTRRMLGYINNMSSDISSVYDEETRF